MRGEGKNWNHNVNARISSNLSGLCMQLIFALLIRAKLSSWYQLKYLTSVYARACKKLSTPRRQTSVETDRRQTSKNPKVKAAKYCAYQESNSSSLDLFKNWKKETTGKCLARNPFKPAAVDSRVRGGWEHSASCTTVAATKYVDKIRSAWMFHLAPMVEWTLPFR